MLLQFYVVPNPPPYLSIGGGRFGVCVYLGLRLGANITAGHILLIVLSGFTYKIMSLNFLTFILGLLPLGFIIAFLGLEFAIAIVQAQVFVILTCSYIKDGLDLH